jgi:hypothetical protein
LSIGASALSEAAIAAQVPTGSKKPLSQPAANRRIVAKADVLAPPEPR